MKCHICGSDVAEGYSVCPICNATLEVSNTQPQYSQANMQNNYQQQIYTQQTFQQQSTYSHQNNINQYSNNIYEGNSWSGKIYTGITKKQAKSGLLISFILGIIITIILSIAYSSEMAIYLLILSPFLLTWSFMTMVFGIKAYFRDCIFKIIRLKIISGFVWYFSALIEVVRIVFWSFSSK